MTLLTKKLSEHDPILKTGVDSTTVIPVVTGTNKANKTIKASEFVEDSYTSDDELRPLSAKKGKDLNTRVLQYENNISLPGLSNDKKLLQANDDGTTSYIGIVDNLTTNDPTLPLSAKQGKLLNDNKLEKSSVIDNLTTAISTDALSANQGVVIKAELDLLNSTLYGYSGDTLGGVTHNATPPPTPDTSGKYYFITSGLCTFFSDNVSRTVAIGDDLIVVRAPGSPVTYEYIYLQTQSNRSDSITLSDSGVNASSKAAKTLNDNKAEKTVTITAGAGLVGGGDLSANRTFDIASSTDGITVNADSITLNPLDVLNSTSTTKPLSANQGKVLNDSKVSYSSTLITRSDTDTWASIFLLPYDNFRLKFSSYHTTVPAELSGNATTTEYEVQRIGRNGLIFQSGSNKWAFTSDGGARKDASISDIVNDLTSGGSTKILSAEQGKQLSISKSDKNKAAYFNCNISPTTGAAISAYADKVTARQYALDNCISYYGLQIEYFLSSNPRFPIRETFLGQAINGGSAALETNWMQRMDNFYPYSKAAVADGYNTWRITDSAVIDICFTADDFDTTKFYSIGALKTGDSAQIYIYRSDSNSSAVNKIDYCFYSSGTVVSGVREYELKNYGGVTKGWALIDFGKITEYAAPMWADKYPLSEIVLARTNSYYVKKKLDEYIAIQNAKSVVVLSQLEYDALTVKDANITYQIREKMSWWQKGKMGLFVHWGVYSALAGKFTGTDLDGVSRTDYAVDGYGEWIMYNGKIPRALYKTYASQFTASGFWATGFVQMAKNAGFKYIVITAKHHDGFSLFPSAATTWDVAASGAAGRDLIQELSDACVANGMKLGLYFSQNIDWMEVGGFGEIPEIGYTTYNDTQHTTYVNNSVNVMLDEMFTRYKFDLLWWDMGDKNTNQTLANLIYSKVASYKRYDLIQNNRLSNWHSGNYTTPEQTLSVDGATGNFEMCFTLGSSWGYKSNDGYKTTKEVFSYITKAISLGGNVLMNVGPKADGNLPTEVNSIIGAIGNVQNRASEAFINTTAAPFVYGFNWGRVTRNGYCLYAHLINYNSGDGGFKIYGLYSSPIKAQVMGGSVCKTRQDSDGLWVYGITTNDSNDTVIKLTYRSEPLADEGITIPTTSNIVLSGLFGDMDGFHVNEYLWLHVRNYGSAATIKTLIKGLDTGTYRLTANMRAVGDITLTTNVFGQTITSNISDASYFSDVVLGTYTSDINKSDLLITKSGSGYFWFRSLKIEKI